MIHCSRCRTALAHDQRYCIECGARRGRIPSYVAQIISAISEQGRGTWGRTSFPPVRPRSSAWADGWLAAPRATAAVVIGVLGFGGMVGSLAGGAGATAVRSIIVAVSPSSAPAVPPPSEADDARGAAVHSQTTRAKAPSSAPGSASSPAPTRAPAPTSPTKPDRPQSTLPPVKHVFLILLSGQGYNQTFAHREVDPYLAGKLAERGEVIGNYYSVAAGSLANEIALVSGQGPTPQTLANCPSFEDINPGGIRSDGQVLGAGCSYPNRARTLGDQLRRAHETWKAYVQTDANGTPRRAGLCRPEPGASSEGSPLPSWRNPFLYFHALTDRSACPKTSVPLEKLARDLKSKRTTPSLSYIVPDRCHDGSPDPCTPNAPSGMTAADAFLKSVVPEIEQSDAYKSSGMIFITFDQAPQTGADADPSSCCMNPTYPNLPPSAPPDSSPTEPAPSSTPTTTSATPATEPPPSADPAAGGGQTGPTGGGGRVGMLVLSRYVTPGTMEVFDYFNHFSLLASIEDLFGLKRLGYAAARGLSVFGPSVYTGYSG